MAKEGKDPLIAISEDGENVRRRRPLENKSDAWSRSAYVVSSFLGCWFESVADGFKKGFGEGDVEENTQEKLEEWFDQFGSINAVRKRREDLPDQGFKGKGKGAFKVSGGELNMSD